jgi:Superfamily II DNA and RNA helicases
MRFSDLGLLPELISNAGYDAATPVQAEAIPAVLEGRDVLAGAQTGTGKTAAFTLPMLQRLVAERSTGQPRALILAPTRELAAQVSASVQKYGKGTQLRQVVIYGGVNFNGQLRQLQKGVDILIATPGRLLDHVNQRTIDLSQVKTLVLDMKPTGCSNMGFIGDIEKVIGLCARRRTKLSCSQPPSPHNNKILARRCTTIHPLEVAVCADNTVAANGGSELMFSCIRKTKTRAVSHL